MFSFGLVGIGSAFSLINVSSLSGASWVSICGSGSALGTTVLYMEDYFSKAVDNFGTILGLISIGLSDVARNGASLYMPLLLLHFSRGIRLKLRLGSMTLGNNSSRTLSLYSDKCYYYQVYIINGP